MNIKHIRFYNVPKNESEICDCCNKSIQNIYYITTDDETTLKFGCTCFKKIIKNRGYNKTVNTKINKILKTLITYSEMTTEWQGMTEKLCAEKYPYIYEKIGNTEGIDNFKDLQEFYLQDLIPYRTQEAENELKKYRILSK